jgi:hypothetical protein
VFPEVLVCLDCGFAEFVVPDEQRHTLQDADDQNQPKGAAA